ncbi:dihydrodipicolinate synthase family protein [Microbacterium jejuense]|uniref:Dihydrodipicolinate synthase family protein n=1 Tax=Microbacterium jejuense TaxID=1263637 RepID=A0ABS7HLB2_9MICO|nr:dihydrodipicolinate synthase family protein [Microbacterium jejuense]MBW9093071.1 dihydrodipicolinate synthase family protein [Microbacterium jejuense]
MNLTAGGVLMMAVSPFSPSGVPDLERLKALGSDAAGNGFTGLVVAGGAGELAALTDGEIVDMVAAAAPSIGGQCALIAGIYARPESTRMVNELAAAGADALLCFADPTPDSDADAGLADLLAENARGSNLGVVVDHDGGRFTVAGLQTVSQRYGNLVLKWGTPDLRAWGDLRSQLPGVAAWYCGGGDDVAPGFAAQGADGFTSTAANVAPTAIAALQRLIAEGSLREAGDWVASHLQPLASLRSARPGYVPAVTKAAMANAGRGAGEPRSRDARFRETDAHALAIAVAALEAAI